MNCLNLCLRSLPVFLLLSGCETRRPAHTSPERPQPTTAPTAAQAVARPTGPAPDTADLTRPYSRPPGPSDSLIAIGPRHYRLSVRVETDSARPMEAGPVGLVGPAFAPPADTAARGHRVRGYVQTYTFTLRDSVGKAVVFRRQLHKPDFFAVAPREEVTVTDMPPPSYLGYSAGLDALVFVCYLGVPFTDIGWHATLLLDRRGRVKRLSASGPAYSGAADCDPRISPSGRAVLTCSEVLRAGQPPLRLDRPHAQLRAARFLSDTTLLLVYEYGDYVARPAAPTRPAPTGTAPTPVAGGAETGTLADYELVSTPAQRRLPNACILSTSGRVLRQFRLAAAGALAYELPRLWVPPAGAYVFFEEMNKLVLIPKAHPDSLIELPIRQLPRFSPPQRPREKRYDFRSDFTRLRLYIDTLRPRQVRVQPLPMSDS